MLDSGVTRLLTGYWLNEKQDVSCQNAVTTSHTTKDEESVLAERSSISAGPELLIPDGGLTAWLQCVGSFAILFNSFGPINSFSMISIVERLYHISN